MKKALLALGAVCAFAGSAQAEQTATYGWEDGVGTILGSFGNLVNPMNVDGTNGTHTHTGAHALSVTEAPHGSTPQGYLAFITGLTDGDVIDASFFGYDDAPDASPSLRIWGGYATSDDINNYQGSPGGSNTFTDGNGWGQVSHSWTFDSDGGTRDALVVQVRLYSTPSTDENGSTEYFVDDISVTVSSDTASIHFPTVPAPSTLALAGLGGLVATRRRRG